MRWPQQMADHQHVPADLRRSILTAMMRLCASSRVYPQCLTLQQKVRYNTKAVAGGHFGEIWKGDFEGTPVSLKVAKIYQRSQIKHLLKVSARAFCPKLTSHLGRRILQEKLFSGASCGIRTFYPSMGYTTWMITMIVFVWFHLGWVVVTCRSIFRRTLKLLDFLW